MTCPVCSGWGCWCQHVGVPDSQHSPRTTQASQFSWNPLSWMHRQQAAVGSTRPLEMQALRFSEPSSWCSGTPCGWEHQLQPLVNYLLPVNLKSCSRLVTAWGSLKIQGQIKSEPDPLVVTVSSLGIVGVWMGSRDFTTSWSSVQNLLAICSYL